MKLHIPRLGDQFRLTEPWSFPLYLEHRNYRLLSAAAGKTIQKLQELSHRARTDRTTTEPTRVTLPHGTVLALDRIYIRQHAERFDSLTFVIVECPDIPGYAGTRFWVKLEDANAFEYVPLTGDQRADFTFAFGKLNLKRASS